MSAIPRTIVSTTDSRRPKGGGGMIRRLFAAVGLVAVTAITAVLGSNPWGP
jgi:hypothetical protein